MKKQPTDRRHQSGIVLIVVTIAMLSLLAMGGLALDLSMAFLAKTRVQNALDAAALSGARTLKNFSGNTSKASVDALAAYSRYASKVNFGAAAPTPVIEFSNQLSPFSAGATGVNARYVRARFASPVPVSTYLAQVIPGVGNTLNVGGSAVAGPQGGLQPNGNPLCDVIPVAVEMTPGDTNCSDGACYGFTVGTVYEIKKSSGAALCAGTPAIGPGNFGFVRLDGNGAPDVEKGLAGGADACITVGSTYPSKPGNVVGPASDGMNTRFGQGSTAQYPSDVITTSGISYAQYQSSLASGSLTNANGVPRRRIVTALFTTSIGNGTTDIQVDAVGCFFLREPLPHQGNRASICAEFISDCDPGGATPVPNPPPNAGGFFEIILYKDPNGTVS